MYRVGLNTAITLYRKSKRTEVNARVKMNRVKTKLRTILNP